MPRNGLPNEQIAAALRRAEQGAALDEVGRRMECTAACCSPLSIRRSARNEQCISHSLSRFNNTATAQ